MARDVADKSWGLRGWHGRPRKFVHMSVVVELADVSVVRGTTRLVDGVDWVIEDSDRWVVIGPNGAGKTTLLQILAAHLYPTAGLVGLLGEVVGAVDVFELRPRIGLTSAALADRLPRSEKVSDVVVSASYGVVGRWREEYDETDHKRAAGLLDELGIGHLTERTFGTLLEGERKRVQIVCVLMTDPELMLLDEPTTKLDLTKREQLVRSLGTIATTPGSPTMVLVTHHVEEIPPGITHALLLRAGRVVASGPIGEALTSETLTEAFGLPLVLERNGGRYAARAV